MTVETTLPKDWTFDMDPRTRLTTRGQYDALCRAKHAEFAEKGGWFPQHDELREMWAVAQARAAEASEEASGKRRENGKIVTTASLEPKRTCRRCGATDMPLTRDANMVDVCFGGCI